MSRLVIRNINRTVLKRLKSRAVEHGTTVEIEARKILEEAMARNLADVAARLFGAKHGVVLDTPPRQRIRRPPSIGSGEAFQEIAAAWRRRLADCGLDDATKAIREARDARGARSYRSLKLPRRRKAVR